jgi:hypothetical protein
MRGEEIMDTPFQCGGEVVQFPNMEVYKSLELRVENATDALVYFKIYGTPSSTIADGFVQAAEALSLTKEMLGGNAKNLSVINIGLTDPKIFWMVK